MLTIEEIRKRLSYNPETGDLRWLVPLGRTTVGAIAGYVCPRNGYLRVGLNRKMQQAHRLAWALHHGSWPQGDIDHIDGNKLNNRIANLRDVSKAVNQQNRRLRRINAVGLAGVTSHGKKFEARIRMCGVSIRLGNFGTAEAAHAAYLKARRELHLGAGAQGARLVDHDLSTFDPPHLTSA
jgi:hypothetical protein